MKTSHVLLAIALFLAPATAFADDLKKIGFPYRIKVTSAGIPTLGGVANGYKLRTKYKLFSGKDLVGEAYLGDSIYVREPGEFRVEVNGLSVKERFEIPGEMTRDRIVASWKRSRAIELRPKSLGQRLALPSIWVLHPPQVTGVHNDDYVISRASDGKDIVKGVAVVYPPEEIKDIDDGVLFANTLVHLIPGKYVLKINGGSHPFEVKAQQTQLIRLGALSISDKVPANAELVQRLSEKKRVKVTRPKANQWIVATPGKYTLGKQAVLIEPGKAVFVKPTIRTLPGLRRPRLLVRAISDNGVRITGFLEGSPVAAAGLKVGDRIVAFDGTPVKNTRDLGKLLLEKELGDSAMLSVERPGRKKVLKIKLQLGRKKSTTKRKIYWF